MFLTDRIVGLEERSRPDHGGIDRQALSVQTQKVRDPALGRSGRKAKPQTMTRGPGNVSKAR